MRRAALAAACLAALLASPPWGAAAPSERGIVPIRDAQGAEVGLYRESHALVIGAADYTAGWPRLPGVRSDVAAVRAALEAKGFTVELVLDPTGDRLQKAFREFISRHGLAPENRLLFWFAGHGYSEKMSYGREMGYIVPVDAPLPERDRPGFLNSALSMQRMEEYARQIEAKHALFLFDSCFSGQLFSLARSVPEQITYKTSLPVRQFLTAGSADEQVSDRSVFREQFEDALAGEADRNKDGYVTGTELGEFLQEKVIRYSRGAQHPQYGKINDSTLDKGDFVFLVARPGAAPPAGAAPPPLAGERRGAASGPTPSPRAPSVGAAASRPEGASAGRPAAATLPPHGYDVRRDPAREREKSPVDAAKIEELSETFERRQFRAPEPGEEARPSVVIPQPDAYVSGSAEGGGFSVVVRLENRSGEAVHIFAAGQDTLGAQNLLLPGGEKELRVRVAETGGTIAFVAAVDGSTATECRWVYAPGARPDLPVIRFRDPRRIECDAGVER